MNKRLNRAFDRILRGARLLLETRGGRSVLGALAFIVLFAVGSLGLLAAVALTTALAAALAAKLPERMLPTDGHTH